MIFESHAHYDDDAFIEDQEMLLNAMQQNGIQYIVNVGASIKSTAASIELSKKYPFIYAAAGVHPNETAELNEEKLLWLKEQCMHDKVVAVGEIGLDYYWNEPEPEIQKYWFIRQLALAKQIQKPVIIHSRDAAKETMDILAEHEVEKLGGVIHCYSYSWQMAMQYVDMGYYIGIGGVVTFKNAKKIQEVVQAVPLERILLETDSPYLSPHPNRGKRNSSLNLPYIAQSIADIKGVSYEQVVGQTFDNAKKMYGI